jgi:uncharacterized damage-inducible protein DinB
MPRPMSAGALLRRLLAHARWAEARVHTALVPVSPPEAGRLFAHLAAAAVLWQARIEGRAAPLPVWPDLSPDEALAHAHAAYDAFGGMIETEDLGRAVSYVNSKGEAFESTVGDILTHVCQHGAYHRGQIARVLREAGHAPPYTDFIQFARAPDA